MPLKAAIMPFLDEISVEGQVTSACNTIVKVPLSADAVGSPNYKLVGTNTDSMSLSFMGVRRRGRGFHSAESCLVFLSFRRSKCSFNGPFLSILFGWLVQPFFYY